MGKILICHIGYSVKENKVAIYQTDKAEKCLHFSVVDEAGMKVMEGLPVYCGKVSRWNTGEYWQMDFSSWQKSGRYRIRLEKEDGICVSDSFEIGDPSVRIRLISGLGYYFKAQRSTGEWDYEDSHLSFLGDRAGKVDAHGGWFDATGDYGIHMSHLSHSTWYNPQQLGLSTYFFFLTAELLQKQKNEQYSMVLRRLLDEGTYGADFIMRMRAPSGSFFRSICRSPNAFMSSQDTRKIQYEYRTFSTQFAPAAEGQQEGIADENYEVSFRSGAGLAIASLAAAARHPYPGTAYTCAEYLAEAKVAMRYLKEANERYTNDGQWNLIDEYCALLAANELYRTSAEYEYMILAREFAEKILARCVPKDGGLWLETEPGRPFHHPSDEALPVIALLQYGQLCGDKQEAERIIKVCELLMKEKLRMTKKCVNPFQYPRFEYLDDGKIRELFFFPHNTTASPWWQGENSRILSFASAARLLCLKINDEDLKKELTGFADAQVQWVLGKNPYDSSMMEGYGKNQIQYFFKGRYDFVNCPGGVVNGITSALDDEEGIAFVLQPTEEVDDNWRWAEQWIPHASWLLLAVAADDR